VRALIVGDVHLSDRPPSVRTDTYADDILDKLRWCVNYANEHADVMLFLGDLWHIKAPSRTSHRLVMRTAEVLEEFRNGRVLIVPGNHDMSQDRLESLESQPLGTLCLSPNIDLLIGYDRSTGIFGLPYLQDWGPSFERWMQRFGRSLPGLVGFGDPEYEDDPKNEFAPASVLLATHAPIFPPGMTPPYDHIPAEEWASWMRWPVPVVYGHIHEQHGFYQVGEQWFCNNGAISRGSLHEETLAREPKVTLFGSEATGCPFTSVDVPHKPASEVFRLAEVVEKKGAETRLEGFLDSIGDVALTSISVEEIVAHARTTDLPAAAITELEDIISQVMS
jgi:hypothetical protein